MFLNLSNFLIFHSGHKELIQYSVFTTIILDNILCNSGQKIIINIFYSVSLQRHIKND